MNPAFLCLMRGRAAALGWVVALCVAAVIPSVSANGQSCGGSHHLEVSPCIAAQNQFSQPNKTFNVQYTVNQGVYGYYGLAEVESWITNYNGTGIQSCSPSDAYITIDPYDPPAQITLTCTSGPVATTPGNAIIFGRAQLTMWDGYTLLNGYNVVYVGVYNGFTAEIGMPSATLHQRAECVNNCFPTMLVTPRCHSRRSIRLVV